MQNIGLRKYDIEFEPLQYGFPRAQYGLSGFDLFRITVHY